MVDQNEPVGARMGEGLTAVAQLAPGRSDRVYAADLKKRLGEALGPVIEIMNEARDANIILGFGLGRDQFGRTKIDDISAMKPL